MSARRVVAGRYRLEERIGSGAMGVVWRGTDERLGRPVAIKQVFLHGGLDQSEADEVRQRTLREGRIAARLQHPHAISVFDASIEGDEPWLVMEYLPSRSLAAVLAEQGPLEPRLVARIGRQVADALDAAHQAGIVHRDVKPGNVLIGADGTVKITDFGISRASGDLTLTRTGMLAGTPAYLAPEVARGDDSSSASDVFSLGATLYAAVEGVPPFGADDNALALLHAVAAGAVHPPLQAGPLTALLMRLLRSEPGERPTAAQARGELGRIAHGGTSAGRPTGRGGRGRAEGDGSEGGDESLAGFGTATSESAPAGREAAPVGPNATRRAVPGPTEPWADRSPGTSGGAPAPGGARAEARTGAETAASSGSPAGSVREAAARSGSNSAWRATTARPGTAPAGRPTRRVAIAVLVVALIAGAIVGVVAVTLGQPDASGTSGASIGDGGGTAAPTDTAAQQVAAVRDYYATVTGNSGAGWARLGPELQGAAGGFSGYQSFWSTIASTRVQDAEAVDDDTVRATVQFVPRNRSATDEVHDLGMVRGTGGTWLIDSDRLVPAAER